MTPTERPFTTGIPACMSWEPPDDELRALDPEDWSWWNIWHAQRCGICGVRDFRLVKDHDHATGKVRGLLCRSCNGREAHSAQPVFVAWREGMNSAARLGIDETYWSPFTGEWEPDPPIDPDVADRIAAAVVR